MQRIKIVSVEAGFLLIFGVLHFAIPFLLPPNTAAANTSTVFSTLHITDFVLPGTFALAILSLIFLYTKNRYPAAGLAFLYFGGIALHSLFFLGLVPAVIIVPSPLFLAFGIILDALAIVSIYDYLQRKKLG
jgi:hypothetical protein